MVARTEAKEQKIVTYMREVGFPIALSDTLKNFGISLSISEIEQMIINIISHPNVANKVTELNQLIDSVSNLDEHKKLVNLLESFLTDGLIMQLMLKLIK